MTVQRHHIWCHAVFGFWLLVGGQAAAQMDAIERAGDGRSAYVIREYLLNDVVPSRVTGYMPMARDKFESKLKAMQRITTDEVAGEARLVSGVFYAKYQDGQLVDGRAGLEVVNTHQANSVLSLAPCRLPIAQLRWSDLDEANVTSGAGVAGSYLVFVDRSSRLMFSWSLRGEASRAAAGSRAPVAKQETNFSISLPASSINQLVIDLPKQLIPVADAGDVRLVSDGFADLAVVPKDVDSGSDRWLLTLGGTHEFALRVMDRAAAAKPNDITRLRQATTYRLLKSAIEIQAEISLAFSQSELHRLVLQTDPDLRVARVRIGQRELLPDQITRGTQPGQVVLTFDTPLKGANRKLIVDALSPLVMNQPMRLPTLRPLHLAWEQATAVLEVPDTLLLKKLVCSDAVETSVETRPGVGGESHQFQFYSQEATCEVVIGRPSTRTVVTSGTAIAVSSTTLTAQIVADVQAVDGEVYLLDALIDSRWKVDSVESTPADALDGTPSRRTRGRRIRVQLRQPISGDRKVRLLIKAHRGRPAATADLTAEDFRVVDFGNVAEHRRLVSLRAEAPYHLMVAGNSQPNVDPNPLSDADRELLGPFSSGLDYVDDGAVDDFRVSLTQEKPRYSGSISVEAMADAEVLRQAIRIHCQPESSPVSSLLVRLSPAPDVPLSWSTDEPDGVRSARLIKSTGPQATATWELQLRQSRTTPFHLTAVCSRPLIDTTPVVLASLVDAIDQTGTVTVGAIDGTTLKVAARGLTAIPIVRPREDEYTFQRVAYRYDSNRDHTVTVSRQSDDPRQSTLAWVWACNLASRIETSGVASHQVQFKIQNSGRPQIEITLPATATVHRVSIDETEVSHAKSSGGTQRITIQLPLKKRYPTVRVDYATRGEPFRDFSSTKVGWPLIDLFCLKRTWDIWLPPGVHAREDSRFVNTAVTPSLSWRERLLGAAILRRDRRPFDLFSLPDWRTIGQTASGDARETAAGFVTALTNVVAATDTPDAANQTLTWGQVLSRYQRLRGMTPSSARLVDLRIDARALRDQEVTADSIYSTETGETVSQILARHNLAFVASPDSILLTSVACLGDFDHELRATRDRQVFITQREGSSFASVPGRAISPNVWLDETSVRTEPWTHPAREGGQEFNVGWRHYRLHPAGTPIVQFAVYRPAVFRVIGWGVSFIMFAAVVGFSTHRAKMMVLVVLAAMFTLLVPVQFVPVARGVMWGGLGGFVLTFLRAKAISAPPRAALPRGAAVTLARATVILLIAFGAWQVLADDDAKNSTPHAVRIYRVVIPVDDEQKPVGDFVYVPVHLFNSLHRRAATAQIASLTWLLRSATYEASLAPRGDADGLVGAEVSADFELETFQVDTTFAFPLGRDGVRFLTNVKLDGQVIEPAWNSTGEALEFLVSRPGRHRLELTIRPVLRNDAESSGFALHIPEFAGARLKVTPSMRIAGIELPSAIGAVDQSESLGTIEADLGPTNLLAVRWPLSSKTVAESIPLTVVERFWLRIQPSSVVLEGQFSFSVPSGGIEQVRLLVDPHLKLSQLIPSQSANYETESGPIPSIAVRFDDPDANQVFVHVTFLMTDTSGLGNVYLPRLSAIADVKGGSTLGLSVAPQLEAQLVAEPPLQAILPAEFLADWKEPTDTPQLAYRLAERSSRWHVTSRPRPVQPVTQQFSSWSIGLTRVGLRFSADVDPAGQERFQQRLRVPQSLEITNLQVFRGEEAYPVRWTRAKAVLTVFFDQAIKERYRLVIEGAAPTAFRERTVLPLVSLRDVEFQSNRMVVRQRSDVLIQNLEATGLVDESNDTSESIQVEHDHGRIVNSYVLPPVAEGQAEATLSFLTRRNRPRISGRIVNHLGFGEDNQWFADTQVTLDVKSGVVDELRMALPVGWSEPLMITPETRHEIVGTDAERVLVLRPGEPIRNQFRLRIRCETQRATVASAEVPLVEILNEGQVEQFLVLPGRQGEELISWETSGLQQIQNLSNQGGPPPDDASTSYRVEDARVTAVVQNVGRLGGTSQVQLADIHVAWNCDRTCYGVVAFDVTPLQLTECLLVVPAGVSIAHVSVAGVPVTWRSESENRIWIPLGPEQLPQRIDVVFSGQLRSTAAVPGEMISAPSLADLPVEQTLWTIHGPAGAMFEEAFLEHTRTSEVRQARIRAHSATMALELAETITPPVPEAGFESWTQTWQRRRDLATRIVDGTPDPRVAAETANLDPPVRNLQETENGRGQPARFEMQGAAPSINIQIAHDDVSDLGLRAGISVAIACLGLMFGFARRKVRLSEWIEQSWHALGVTLGIVWWLWFTPSFVGLVLMGIFLVAALWPVRKSRLVPRALD